MIQSWQSFVYHLTARGGQFQHGKLTKDHSQKSEEWQKLMNNSTREFFRKWGTSVQHNNLMMPIVTPKLDIGFVVKNCELNLLNHLEPWCSTIYVDCEFEDYIKYEQPNTTDNLTEKIFSIHSEKQNDILIRFDAKQITNQSYQYITQLANIITDDDNFFTGTFEFDIFEVEIINKNTYEGDLIKC